jgi:hypothetical protein
MTKPVCIARDLFHVVRDSYLEPFLGNWGFKHSRKDAFFRIEGDTVWYVYIDFNRDVPRDQGRIDVIVGVGYHSLDRFLKSFPGLAERIANCRGKPTTMGADLALLHPRENREFWIYASSDPAEVANLILDELRTVGFDWLEKYGALDKTIAAWEDGRSRLLTDTMYLAAAYWLRGEHERALKLIEYERDQYGPAETKRTMYHEVESADQFYDWLIQQPKSDPAGNVETGKKRKPRKTR